MNSLKKYVIAGFSLGTLIGGGLALWLAIAAPARAAERNLAAISALSVGNTTEVELLSRPEFQKVDRMCMQETCFYHTEVQNTLLTKLHLAPRTFLGTWVQVSDGLVTGVSAFVMKEGLAGASIHQMKSLPSGCSTAPCVKRIVGPAKRLFGIQLVIDNQSDVRNHLPLAMNARCLSQFYGCATYAELMPLSKGLDLGESSAGVSKPPQ